MADGVKTPRRAYHSPLRADQAEQTRRRILESARQLFVRHGYTGTTVAAVAADAGVSPETIYLSLGGKRGLLEGVMDITGPHDTTDDDNAWWQMVAGLPTSSERLTRMVEYSCRILARTRPIHAIIRGAADKEAFAAALGQQLLEERLTNQTARIRAYLDGDLTSGLSNAEAGQRYCALTSPDLYHVLTVQLHWTVEHHQQWVTDVLHTDLLGDPRRAANHPRRQRGS